MFYFFLSIFNSIIIIIIFYNLWKKHKKQKKMQFLKTFIEFVEVSFSKDVLMRVKLNVFWSHERWTILRFLANLSQDGVQQERLPCETNELGQLQQISQPRCRALRRPVCLWLHCQGVLRLGKVCLDPVWASSNSVDGPWRTAHWQVCSLLGQCLCLNTNPNIPLARWLFSISLDTLICKSLSWPNRSKTDWRSLFYNYWFAAFICVVVTLQYWVPIRRSFAWILTRSYLKRIDCNCPKWVIKLKMVIIFCCKYYYYTIVNFAMFEFRLY